MAEKQELPTRDIPTRALVVEEAGSPFKLTDVILDEVRENELLVEILYSGICHADLLVAGNSYGTGVFPAILGHEGAGIIRRVGPGIKKKHLKPGQPVLLTLNTCQNCHFCKSGSNGSCIKLNEINFKGGRLTDCTNPARMASDGRPVRTQFFGQSSFSRFSVVREQSVIPYYGGMESIAMLSPMSCGYNTGASTVIDVIRPAQKSSIAIVGAGAVGFAALMAAKALGVERIIAIDIVDSKLETASELGATHTINSKISDIQTEIRKIVPDGVDAIVETTGLKSLIEGGFKALSHGGVLTLVGVPKPGELSIDALDMFNSCKKLVGVIAGASDPHKSIPELIELHQDGRFPVEKIGKVYSMARFEDAISELKGGKVVKAILAWDENE